MKVQLWLPLKNRPQKGNTCCYSSEISVQNNLILEAKPMTEDQPEYKAIENYALAAGGEKGIIGPICNKIKLLLAKSAP